MSVSSCFITYIQSIRNYENVNHALTNPDDADGRVIALEPSSRSTIMTQLELALA